MLKNAQRLFVQVQMPVQGWNQFFSKRLDVLSKKPDFDMELHVVLNKNDPSATVNFTCGQRSPETVFPKYFVIGYFYKNFL